MVGSAGLDTGGQPALLQLGSFFRISEPAAYWSDFLFKQANLVWIVFDSCERHPKNQFGGGKFGGRKRVFKQEKSLRRYLGPSF